MTNPPAPPPAAAAATAAWPRTPLHRRGPRPLLLHLLRTMLPGATLAAGASEPLNGAPGWALPEGPLASLADPALLAGIAAYRRHPWRRDLPEPPAIWQEGDSRLLDYGATAEPTAPDPARARVAIATPTFSEPRAANSPASAAAAPGSAAATRIAQHPERPGLPDHAAQQPAPANPANRDHAVSAGGAREGAPARPESPVPDPAADISALPRGPLPSHTVGDPADATAVAAAQSRRSLPDAPTPTRPHAPTPGAPMSDAPTPDAPTPDAPTPDAPTSDAPTSDAPTSDAPTSDAPTSSGAAPEIAAAAIALAHSTEPSGEPKAGHGQALASRGPALRRAAPPANTPPPNTPPPSVPPRNVLPPSAPPYTAAPYTAAPRNAPDHTAPAPHPPASLPVLFVPSLVNRAHVLDLAPGRSLLRFLAEHGVRPLLLDWGWPGTLERGFTLTDYIAGRLERALGAVGGPVVLAGYCMGGLMAAALAARRPEQVRGLALLATPWDFHAPDPMAAARIAAQLPWFEPALASTGTLPVDALQIMFAALDPDGIAARYRRFGQLDPAAPEAELFVALEDWLNDGVPLAAPVARECLAGWYGANSPARGTWRVAGAAIDPGALCMPTFVAIPGRDRIVPPESAAALAAQLPNAIVHRPAAGHIGMVAGRHARAGLWEPLLQWLQAIASAG